MNFNEEQEIIQELRKRQSSLNTEIPACLYHYRTLEGFWNIIESDSFWATNARFSNDQEEQMLGVNLISENLNLDEEEGKTLLKDCYIVCFCEVDDCLSQWRGYGQDGVSIGFDFSDIQSFCVEKGDKKISCYNRCCGVKYFSKETEKEELANSFLIPHNFSRNKLPAIVPFIKHQGFHEEKEFRLVFEDQELYELVQYRNQNGKKIPYIVVKSGTDGKVESKQAYIRLVTSTSKQGKVKDIIQKQLKKGKITVGTKTKISVDIIECGKVDIQEEQCAGCMKKKCYDILNYGEGWTACKENGEVFFVEEDAVYISQCKEQDKVFDVIYNALHEELKDDAPKVWCEGHLPVRTITVGPRADKEQVRECIEHYCRHTYWLKDVEVKSSTIPYRS